jgi:hypothetical protein
MRTITTTILILICIGNTLGQNNEKLAKKITKKMCDCIGFIDKYENLNAKLDSCYDLALNDIIMNATPKEIQIIGNTEEFNEVKNRIGKLIKVDCDAVKNVIIQEVQSSINESSYPTNFTTKELKEAKRNLDSYDGKIIAFDEIIFRFQSNFSFRLFSIFQRQTPQYHCFLSLLLSRNIHADCIGSVLQKQMKVRRSVNNILSVVEMFRHSGVLQFFLISPFDNKILLLLLQSFPTILRFQWNTNC